MVHNFVVHKVVYHSEALFFLAFPDFEHHSMRHLESIREVDAITAISLLVKGGFFLAAQHLNLTQFQVDWGIEPIGIRHGAFLLIEEEDGVDLIAFLGETELAVGEWINGTGAVDGFAVNLHPFTDLLHAEQGRIGQVAIGVGTYVKEKVAAFGHDVAQQMNQVVGALVMVGGDI